MHCEQRSLTAVVYEAGTGAQTDRLLADVAARLEASGNRLAGTVQRAFERAHRCACDMIVRDLATGDQLKISEDRGPNARGCRLDPRMLEALVGSASVALDSGVDAVIINKFGKQEALGAGFRDVIARASADGVPTLVAVNLAYLDTWRAFAADFADELPPEFSPVNQWLVDRLPEIERSCSTEHAPRPDLADLQPQAQRRHRDSF